jgi:hypothetical protein
MPNGSERQALSQVSAAIPLVSRLHSSQRCHCSFSDVADHVVESVAFVPVLMNIWEGNGRYMTFACNQCILCWVDTNKHSHPLASTWESIATSEIPRWEGAEHEKQLFDAICTCAWFASLCSSANNIVWYSPLSCQSAILLSQLSHIVTSFPEFVATHCRAIVWQCHLLHFAMMCLQFSKLQ